MPHNRRSSLPSSMASHVPGSRYGPCRIDRGAAPRALRQRLTLPRNAAFLGMRPAVSATFERPTGKKVYKWVVADEFPEARSTDKLALARRHLGRVLGAWDTPTDWDDLSLYGFYCLEAAVEAAAVHVGMRTSKRHWEKADVARELHRQYGLPDVERLLRDLNDARKSAAYGDVPAPDLSAEDVASEIEGYVDAVAELVEKSPDNEA